MEPLRLRTYDGVALTGLLMLPPLFSTALSKLTEQNSTAAWLAMLMAFAIMLCLFLIASLLMSRYEGKSIIEIATVVLGKPIGILYGILIGAYFCFFTGINVRESTEILKIYGLSLTPVYVVAGLILLTALIMNFFGGRSIIKTTGLFYIIVIFGVVFVLLLGINRYNPGNLAPVFGNGLPEIAKNGAFLSSMLDCVMVLFLFAPAFKKTSKMRKSGVLSIAITAGAYVLLSICFVMMFSASVGEGLMSGVMEMGKTSYYNHFIYRFESLFLFFLIFAAILQATVGLFAARESLTCVFKPKATRIAVVICTAVIAVSVFLPANIIELTQKYLPALRRYSVFFMAGLPMLLLVISTVKRVFKYEKA